MTVSEVHPRITVNPMATIGGSLPEAIAVWAELGVRRVGMNVFQLEATGWDEALQLVRGADLDVVYLNYGPAAAVDDPAGWAVDEERLRRAITFAAATNATCVYFCTGSPGSCLWEDAVGNLAQRVAPLLLHATESGVRLTLEPCHSSRPELGFLHTVRDAISVATALDIGVCVDLYASWLEPGLGELLRDHADRIDLVQLSDFVIGTLNQPNRWVPGDGDLPLDALLDVVLASGYNGPIDIELLGPVIAEEGPRSALGRSIAWLDEALTRRGVTT